MPPCQGGDGGSIPLARSRGFLIATAAVVLPFLFAFSSLAQAPQSKADPRVEEAQYNRAQLVQIMERMRLHIESARTPVKHSIGAVLDGAFVERVMMKSPAHLAGLRPNDVILAVNGEAVNEETALVKIQAAETLTLEVQNKGGRKTVGPMTKSEVRFYPDDFVSTYESRHAVLARRLNDWGKTVETAADLDAMLQEGKTIFNDIVKGLTRPIGMWLSFHSVSDQF